MAKLINVEKTDLNSPSLKFCEELEAGNILFFSSTPFDFPRESIEFLLRQKQSGSKNRKNIAFKPGSTRITNAQKSSATEEEKLLSIMQSYSKCVTQFLSVLLFSYAEEWKLDYASFRPFQERGRKLRLRARNDLLHTDAFPTRPMHGSRILRFFTNINPNEGRKWMTSDSFTELAQKFAGLEKIPFPKPLKNNFLGKLKRAFKKRARKAGLPVVLRSPYDDFMMRFHNYLKENEDFQKNCHKDHWEFPPGSCWLVFTDQVSHAALSGQYALEQTILIPRRALLNPEKAPISVLERLTGENMIDPMFA